MYVYTRLLNIVTSHQRASIVTFWIPQIHWVIPLCVVTINRKESVVEKWRFTKNFYKSTVLSVMVIPFAKLTNEPIEEKKFVAGTGDLWMVLCHSMNVGSVVGTLKPYLMRNCVNFLHSQVMGTQNLQTQVFVSRHECSYHRSCPSHLVKLSLIIFLYFVIVFVHVRSIQ